MSCSRRIAVCTILAILSFFSLSVSLYAQPEAGLVAYWPFNGNANDAGGRSMHGVLHGPTRTLDRFGNLDSALSFDGVDDYIDVPNSGALNLDITTGITFSYWLRACSPSGFGVVMERYGNSVRQSRDSGWTLGTMPARDGGLSVGVNWHQEYLHDRAGLRPTINDGKWHNVAVVVRQSNITFYVDGLFERMILIDSTEHCCYNTFSSIRIGAGSWGPWTGSLANLAYFRGALDDIRIFDRGLTELEVRAIFNESAWPTAEQKLGVEIIPVTNTTICNGSEVQVRIQHTGNGIIWNTTQGVTNPNGEIVTLRPQKTTTYIVSAFRPGFPCVDTVRVADTITVTVAEAPKAVAYSLPYLSACASDTILLGGKTTGGTPPYRWRWSPATGLDNPNAEYPRLVNGTPGRHRYSVLVTDAKGCTDSAEVSIILFPSPSISFPVDTIYSCPGSGVVIGATAAAETLPSKYSWSPKQGLNRTDTSVVIAYPKSATRYILTAQNVTGCTSSDTIVVIPSPQPIHLGDDPLICPGNTVSIGVQSSPGIVYQWTPATGLENPAAAMTNASPTVTTLYRLRATDPRTGCSVTDSMLVRVYDSQLSTNKSRIDFGTLNGCTEDSIIYVQITNNGTMATRLEEWTSSNPAFSLVDPNFFVPAGRSVITHIRYAPQEEGTHEGTISLSFGSCSQGLTFQLSGAKRKAGITLEPAQISFPTMASCSLQEIDTVIRVVNSGTSPATLTAASIPLPFVVASPSLPVTVLPGTTQIIRLRYAPTESGDFSAQFSLSYQSQECTDVLHAPLAAVVEEPDLQFEEGKVDFGLLDGCRFEQDTTIFLRNASDAEITITEANVPEGYVLLNPLPALVSPGENLPLHLKFAPTGNARFDGTLLLATEPCARVLLIELHGEKQGVWFTIPDTLDFGELVLCAEQNRSLSLPVLFDGDGEGKIRIASITGPFAAAIADGTPLPAGTEQQFAVNFTPAGEGEYLGEMVLAMEPCSLQRRIVLRGKATQLELNGNNYALSIMSNDAPVVADILFRNTGSTPAEVAGVQGVAAPFTLLGTTPQLPATLQPGEELRVTVRYIPFPEKAQSPVQVVMIAPCPLVTEVMIYADGKPGPGTVLSPSSTGAE